MAQDLYPVKGKILDYSRWYFTYEYKPIDTNKMVKEAHSIAKLFAKIIPLTVYRAKYGKINDKINDRRYFLTNIFWARYCVFTTRYEKYGIEYLGRILYELDCYCARCLQKEKVT